MTGAIRADAVCVIILTYGNRWKYLADVLTSLSALTHPVSHLILVDNGSVYPLGEKLRSLSGLPPFTFVDLGSNLGSAAGYKAGLEAAMKTDCEYFWMLDDDNRPAPEALSALFEARKKAGGNPDHLFASYRDDREKFVRVLFHGESLTIGDRDSFMGFRLDRIRMMAERRRRRRLPASKTAPEAVEIGYTVYGGLLLHRKWPLACGYPDESYFLYMDDREYTARLAARGARIFLVSGSRVQDLETAWNVGSKKSLPMLDAGTPGWKAYYTVRNLIAFEKGYLVKNRLYYRVNMTVFLVVLAFRSILINRALIPALNRFSLIFEAVRDGDRGRMGRTKHP
jgi:GT2 family glycosyltransferase